jgi:hypothetical protein
MWNCRRPFLYLTLGIIQAIHSIEEYLTHLQDWLPVVTTYIHNHTGISSTNSYAQHNTI